jgi:hypothetical protein
MNNVYKKFVNNMGVIFGKVERRFKSKSSNDFFGIILIIKEISL